MVQPQQMEIYWSVLYLIEAVVIILANILSLSIFVRKFRHCKTSSFLLINLSIADLLVGCIEAQIAITNMIPTSPTDSTCASFHVTILKALSHVAILESVSTLALIAIERAFAVIKPLRHRVVETKYYRYAIVVTWCISVIPSVCEIAMLCEDSTLRNKVVFVLCFLIVILSLVIMIISYVAIYIKMRFLPVFQHDANTQMQMKLCKTLFIATVASIITLMPFGLFYSYFMEWCRPSCVVFENVYNATLALAFSNSFINLLIYAWKIPEFGKELNRVICFCRKTESLR